MFHRISSKWVAQILSKFQGRLRLVIRWRYSFGRGLRSFYLVRIRWLWNISGCSDPGIDQWYRKSMVLSILLVFSDPYTDGNVIVPKASRELCQRLERKHYCSWRSRFCQGNDAGLSNHFLLLLCYALILSNHSWGLPMELSTLQTLDTVALMTLLCRPVS